MLYNYSARSNNVIIVGAQPACTITASIDIFYGVKKIVRRTTRIGMTDAAFHLHI